MKKAVDGQSTDWLVPAMVSALAGLVIARLAAKEQRKDEATTPTDAGIGKPGSPEARRRHDEALERLDISLAPRTDPTGVAPYILCLEFVGLGVLVLALAFIIPPAYYAALIVFGPVSLLCFIVIIFHLRLQRAVRESKERQDG